jgi:hypothetical protein
MIGNVKVNYSPGSYFHHDKDVQYLEACCSGDKKVTGQDGFRMISNKCHPALRVHLFPSDWIVRHISPHRSWRYSNAHFQEKLGGDAFFAPGYVV